MKDQAAVPFVDTNIIPDRNAGIGSLLWDLQNPRDPDRDGPPLLDLGFAFIDVGVSRAQASTALRAVLAGDLKMDVAFVATERPEAVPCANVALLGERAEEVRAHLSRVISSEETRREITNWHYVVDRSGKSSSVSYSYAQHGNELWESYFMGRRFIVSGEEVEFLDEALDGVLAPDVSGIEARIALERKRDADPSQPGPSWDGYSVERRPLEAGLAACGITLQATEVPQRIAGRQNVLFLGNVLNHHPPTERARELDRIATTLEEGDLVIVQVDEAETSSIDVLQVRGHRGQKTRERVRWINTRTLEVLKPVRVPGSWRQTGLTPALDRLASRLEECLGSKVIFPNGSQEDCKVLVHRHVSHVCRTYFRALPVAQTIRIAIREVLRRWPCESGLQGIPVFEGDATDAYGGALGSDSRPIVSEADLSALTVTQGALGPPPRTRIAHETL